MALVLITILVVFSLLCPSRRESAIARKPATVQSKVTVTPNVYSAEGLCSQVSYGHDLRPKSYAAEVDLPSHAYAAE